MTHEHVFRTGNQQDANIIMTIFGHPNLPLIKCHLYSRFGNITRSTKRNWESLFRQRKLNKATIENQWTKKEHKRQQTVKHKHASTHRHMKYKSALKLCCCKAVADCTDPWEWMQIWESTSCTYHHDHFWIFQVATHELTKRINTLEHHLLNQI